MFRYATVIVTYNRVSKLKKEIQSLIEQKILPEKIIIIDNCSNDGTKTYLESLLNSDMREMLIYKRLDDNFGGSRGFYEGIKEAMQLENIDWIALGDDDINYDVHFFENISLKSKANGRICCFTGKVLYPNEDLQLAHRRRIIDFLSLKQQNVEAEEYSNDFLIDIFSFVGVVINKKIISKAGLPEKDYFIWCDDTEYSLRVRQYTQILNVCNASVFHDTINNENSRFEPSWKMYYGKRNTILMNKKHSKNPVYYKILIPFFYTKDMCSLFIKFRYYHPFIKKMMFIYYNAYKDGIRGIKGKNKQFLP